MAKDKMLQQASWEKKKDKLDRKQEKQRAAMRNNEKEIKRRMKEEQQREQKEAPSPHRGAESKAYVFGSATLVLIVGFYLAAMNYIIRRNKELYSADEILVILQADPVLPVASTILFLLALLLTFRDVFRRIQRIKEEEQQLTANAIKGQLERKQNEKEYAEQAKKRQLLSLQQAKERAKKRMQGEATALQQAKELARALRLRREQRQAEEARARAAATVSADSGERDAFGWTAKQRGQLREAVVRYPEGWSHARKKRWEMIASEVEGQDARACEATFKRLEEARVASASDKAGITQDVKASSAGDLEDDLDWLGGIEGEDTTAGDAFDESDDEEVEDEPEETRERMAVELEPEHKGTEIRLDGIKSMQGCATVQVELLHLQLACADCRTATRVFLSGADEDAADAKAWCEGCSGLIAVHLRPTLLHQANSRLCYVDCVRCTVTDMLPSVLMSACGACDSANVHKQEFSRNRILSGACFSCHAKYSFGAESIKINQVTPCDPGGGRVSGSQKKADDDDPMDELAEELRYLRKKAKNDPRQQLIKLGSPLPQMGACRHFKKSYKWYRFACCGRAFPCPECHIQSGCPAAGLGAHASKMICGKCSMEQSYSPARPCEKCGFTMIAKGSSHWDDGAGTRNLTAMCTKDSKKFKGGLRQANSKTKTSSAKADRVGAKAKAKREHAKKFGTNA